MQLELVLSMVEAPLEPHGRFFRLLEFIILWHWCRGYRERRFPIDFILVTVSVCGTALQDPHCQLHAKQWWVWCCKPWVGSWVVSKGLNIPTRVGWVVAPHHIWDVAPEGTRSHLELAYRPVKSGTFLDEYRLVLSLLQIKFELGGNPM